MEAQNTETPATGRTPNAEEVERDLIKLAAQRAALAPPLTVREARALLGQIAGHLMPMVRGWWEE